MRYFLIILALLGVMVGGVLADTDSADELPVPVMIETADVRLTAEGEYVLVIDGVLGTGCDYPVNVQQVIESGVLYVDVYQMMPVDIFCPMVIVPYNDAIKLDVVRGVTAIIVNDELTFDLPAAQSAEPDAERIFSTVERVEVPDADGVLRFSGFHPDGCDVDVQIVGHMLAEDWLVVDVFRDVPFGIACTMNIPPFSAEIDLDDLLWDDPDAEEPVALDADALRLIEVNDIALLWSADAAEWQTAEREVPLILTVDAETDAPALVVSMLFDATCDDVPVRWWTRPALAPDTFDVAVYRVLANDADCDDDPLTVRARVEFSDDLPPGRYDYRFVIGAGAGLDDGEALTGDLLVPRPRPPQVDLSTRSPHVLEGITVTVSADRTVILFVDGYIPDGCETEAIVDVAQEDRHFDVTIYRVIPAGVACPMVIVPFSKSVDLGQLEAGDYTLTINGEDLTFRVD
ncbi:MAG: hypothetical protein EA396_11575 [Anaerolineaceae bacterium]|nr:MAG: hypothetical protein EA396_11575 [Anaerolineaceae bacterium]